MLVVEQLHQTMCSRLAKPCMSCIIPSYRPSQQLYTSVPSVAHIQSFFSCLLQLFSRRRHRHRSETHTFLRARLTGFNHAEKLDALNQDRSVDPYRYARKENQAISIVGVPVHVICISLVPVQQWTTQMSAVRCVLCLLCA